MEMIREYLNWTRASCDQIDPSEVQNLIHVLMDARKKGQRIFIIGNGGSAATASHFCEDLASVGRKSNRKLFKTLSLADNTSYITALANDYGYDKIFAYQLEQLLQKGDVLIAISASGNSQNLIEAVKYAKSKGAATIGMLGFDGGKLLTLCDYNIHVKTKIGEYGPVEDIHLFIDHIITGYLIERLMQE